MSKIQLDQAVFDLLGPAGFKHNGFFMSTDGTDSSDYGESHHFTHPLGLRIETKFAWREVPTFTFGWKTGDGKYAWCWCDYKTVQDCLRPVIALLLGAKPIGSPLEDPLRSSSVPGAFRSTVAAAKLSAALNIPPAPLTPRCYPLGFHFLKNKRRAFFERHFRHFSMRNNL